MPYHLSNDISNFFINSYIKSIQLRLPNRLNFRPQYFKITFINPKYRYLPICIRITFYRKWFIKEFLWAHLWPDFGYSKHSNLDCEQKRPGFRHKDSFHEFQRVDVGHTVFYIKIRFIKKKKKRYDRDCKKFSYLVSIYYLVSKSEIKVH